MGQTKEQLPEDENIISLDRIINISSLKENDVVVFKTDDLDKNQELIIAAFGRYREELRKKNITVLLIKNSDSIETLNEKTMNEAGWHKKGLIIH